MTIVLIAWMDEKMLPMALPKYTVGPFFYLHFLDVYCSSFIDSCKQDICSYIVM